MQELFFHSSHKTVVGDPYVGPPSDQRAQKLSSRASLYSRTVSAFYLAPYCHTWLRVAGRRAHFRRDCGGGIAIRDAVGGQRRVPSEHAALHFAKGRWVNRIQHNKAK